MSAWLGGWRSRRRVGLILLFMAVVLAIPLALTSLVAIKSHPTRVAGVTLPGGDGAFVPFVVYLLLCMAWGAAAR